MLKKIVCIALCCVLFFVNAQLCVANQTSAEIVVSENKIEISGTDSNKKIGENVTLLIKNSNNNMTYADQTITDGYGNYSFLFDYPRAERIASGEDRVYINCGGILQLTEIKTEREISDTAYKKIIDEDFSNGEYNDKSRWVTSNATIKRQNNGDFALEVNQGSSVTIRLPKPIKSGVVVFEFDFYNTSGSTSSMMIRAIMPESYATMFAITSDNRLRNYNYSNIKQLEFNKWYKLRSVIDIEKQTIELFADNECVYSGAYEALYKTGIAEIEFSNATGENYYLLDNVFLSANDGEEEPRLVCKNEELNIVFEKKHSSISAQLFDSKNNEISCKFSDNGYVHNLIPDKALLENADYLIKINYDGNVKELKYHSDYKIKSDNFTIKNENGNVLASANVVSEKEYKAVSALKTANGTLFDIKELKPENGIIAYEAETDENTEYKHELYLWDSFSNLLPLNVKRETDVLPEKEARAKKLLSELKFSGNTQLNNVKLLYDEGEFSEALEEYKKVFFNRMKQNFENSDIVVTLNGNAQRGRLLYETNLAGMYYFDGKYYELDLGKTGNCNWWHKELYSIYSMGFMQNLMQVYVDTGEKKYLEHWKALWLDFQKNYIKNAPTPEDRVKAQKWRTEPLGAASQLESSFEQLHFAVVKDYDTVLSLFDNDTFISFMRFWQELITDCKITSSTPNQCFTGIATVFSAYPAVCDFVWGDQNLDRAFNQLNFYLEKNYLSDCHDAEMSFNYNYGFIYNVVKLHKSLKAAGYSFLNSELYTMAANRLRSIAATIMPQGMLPNIGKTYSDTDQKANFEKYIGMLEGESLTEIIKSKIFENAQATPAFNSIAFPYVGYYIMREGWEKDSDYVFFRSGRHNLGHSDYQCLQLMLSAMGERLLIAAGPDSYVDLDIGSYLTSSFASNTVSVDGYSQVFDRYTDIEDMTKPINALFHDGSWIAYAEGSYDNGYGNINVSDSANSEKLITDVTHNRQLISDFENGITVVLDKLHNSGNNSHSYTLNWNLAYKFNDLSYVDLSDNGFSTNNNVSGAGLDLYSFTSENISYSKYCGSMNPVRGWHLKSYGIEYEPSLHLEGTYSTAKSDSSVLSLVTPKNGTSTIKSVTKSGTGFSAELINGRKLYSAEGGINLGDVTAKDGFVYIVEDGGSYKGIAVGCSSLKISGVEVCSTMQNLEFSLINGTLSVKEIKSPDEFSWVNTEKGYVPVYE